MPIREWLSKTIAPDAMISLNLPKNVKNASDAGFRQDAQLAHGFSLLPQSNRDYAAAVGDGLGSSVLMSPVKWIQRAFPEACLSVIRENKETGEPVYDHPLLQLIEQPNAHYSGMDLWQATLYSWIVDGNAYWRKIRGKNRQVIELWYTPHWLMEPKWNRGDFISYYEYSAGGIPVRILPEDVVHFRNGIDPRNTRKGMSLVYSELREIFGDDAAANFTAALLKNMGVPGIVFIPDMDESITTDQADAIKEYLKQKFSGDSRGEPIVAQFKSKIEQFGFDPKSMTVSELRDIAEERICAALGVRASVVGFGSGLQTTKVGATLSEDVKMSWNGCIIPTQKAFALKLGQSLLPEFEHNPRAFRVEFDLSEVEALRENRKLTAEAMNIGIAGGWVKVSEGRDALGLPWGPEDEVYLRQLSVIPDDGKSGPTLPTPPLTPKRLKAAPLEERTIASAPDGTPTRQMRSLAVQFVRDALELEADADADFQKFFAKMGADLADIALDVLEHRKSIHEDELITDQILSAAEILALNEDLAKLNGELYLKVARKTYDTIRKTIGLAVDIPDFRAREIVALGGRRAGLIDLEESTRKRLFQVLSEGRSQGIGPEELARQIRDIVPGGPWRSGKTRARVIARTETLHAQRASSLEAYKHAPNVTAIMVFDGRLATSDDDCRALDGKIVEITEAYGLMNEEHPNGSRSFAPVVG